MDLEELRTIKRIAIIALFSDDDLMDYLVLKGGNALDIVYDIADRASLDIDFSTNRDFSSTEIPILAGKIHTALTETFRTHGFEAFDIQFKQVPEVQRTPRPTFWGGYLVEFKVIRRSEFIRLQDNIRTLRASAIQSGPDHGRKFRISISKLEYCSVKQPRDLDFYTVYVYTPEMLVFEKLRAICQQMPDYTINTTPTARARDFFDIYTVIQRLQTDLTSPDSIEILRAVFAAKGVLLSLLQNIGQFREYHRPDFVSVEATVKAHTSLQSFDFYFDYVVKLCESLEPLWIE